MLPTAELWSEYLVTTWNHPCNGHYYLRNGVTVAPGDLVLDCESCEGFFARQALESGAERVLFIEPNREMVECLRATFAAEITAGRVEVISVALAAFAGEANFHVAPGEAFSGAFSEEGNNRVLVATLDQIAAQHGQPTMIKMDLEGHEYEALRGGESTLRDRHPKLAITTYHQPWDFAVVYGLLRGLGYSTIRFSSATMRGGDIPRTVMLHATDHP